MFMEMLVFNLGAEFLLCIRTESSRYKQRPGKELYCETWCIQLCCQCHLLLVVDTSPSLFTVDAGALVG